MHYNDPQEGYINSSHVPVPMHTQNIVDPSYQHPINSFDNDYSFGGRIEPLAFNTAFTQDNFFQSFTDQANRMLNQSMNMFNDRKLLDNFNMPKIFDQLSSSQDNMDDKAQHIHTMTQMSSYSNINGKPKLIQSHDEREMGPGGVWRTRKAHRNTERKIEKMQEGLFIGDRGEIRERYRDPHSGQLLDRQYHQNIPESEKYQFVNEWNRRAENARRRLYGERMNNRHGIQYNPQSINYY